MLSKLNISDYESKHFGADPAGEAPQSSSPSSRPREPPQDGACRNAEAVGPPPIGRPARSPFEARQWPFGPVRAEAEPSRGPDEPLRPLARRLQRRRETAFLELFAGSARLTREAAAAGMRCLPPVEVRDGAAFDLTRVATQRAILRALASGQVWGVHVATPCTICSCARRGIRDFERARAKEVVET